MANLKLTHAKLTSVAAFTAMMIASLNVAALGLGSLEVQSNLDQPFNGEIELTVSPGDDLNSVEATIASREDFESLGIDYPSYLSDMSLNVVTINGQQVLRVNSNGVIINEPFIHFLVRVNWSGGSFLREYTALIDPPVYASETPTTVAQPRVVGIDETGSGTITQSNVQEQSTVSSQSTQSSFSNQAIDAQYGPVARGESLSQIAQDLQQRYPDLSIYQIMRVLFQENQSAFIDQNINGLMAGMVLNIADLNTIRSVDVAESRQFYLDQLSSWDPSSLNTSSEAAVRVGQDDYLFSEDNSIGQDSSDLSSSEGDTDTFQVGSTSDTQSFSSATQGVDQEGEVVALQQQVTELQTSLSSSSLENQELKERISILEGQLADLNSLMNLELEDADLANLQATLAEQNNVDNVLEDGVDSVLESANDFATSADESVDEFLLDAEEAGDSLLTEFDDGVLTDGLSDDLGIDDTAVGLDEGLEEVLEDGIIEDAIEEEVAEEPTPAVVTLSTQPSFIDGLLDNGLWKYILPALAALVGLFMWRRRKADEEFEVSMMTIESHDTINNVGTSKSSVNSVTSINQKGAGASEVAADVPTQNEETSFLTVYSDSDAVVQADEVDPIAEADVYIAYGRNEQAEEVLLDGLATHPERVDIKHKILSLYHKDGNKEGFERFAEELYAQKDSMEPALWSEVSVMGKELLPNNPMFDLSASELFADTQLDNIEAEEQNASADDGVISDVEDNVVDQIDFDDVQTAAEDTAELTAQDDDLHVVNFDGGSDGVGDTDLLADVSENVIEIDLNDNVNAAEESDELEPLTESLVQEVSDLDIDADYDEARTQYELAKVFVDLGDEDGARKILNDIVDNKANDKDVLDDAAKLLESIG
ncbi:MAG: hypothetical protein KTR16_09240 [Acidiferrobacterales bacterium]|nr:hypothetical protein [Acidiferrobacterales bacterium]